MNKVRKRSARKRCIKALVFVSNETAVFSKLMIAAEQVPDRSVTFYKEAVRIASRLHDRRPAFSSRPSSFGVVLFHRLLGNFSGMFWGSSEKSVNRCVSESFGRISKRKEDVYK